MSREGIKLKNKRRGKIFRNFLLSIIFFIVIAFSFFDFWQEIFSLLKLNSAFVVFLDVGQGDAVLIRTPSGKNILIDAGPDNLVLERLGEFLPYFDRRLDYIIVSHAHDDHVNGLKEIFRRFKVDNFIYQSDGESSDFFGGLVENISRRSETELLSLRKELQLIFSQNCFLKILNPLSLSVPDNGNNSLMVKFDCAGQKFLLSGDNELAVEKALLKSDFDLDSDIMKASHHGSKTSNSENFLKVVSPNYFIVSVGLNNRFKHPADIIIERVKKANINIKRTDLEGNIAFPLTNY